MQRLQYTGNNNADVNSTIIAKKKTEFSGSVSASQASLFHKYSKTIF